MTTVAAMQCVEKGVFTLEENISRILPELEIPDVLTRFNENTGKTASAESYQTHHLETVANSLERNGS